MKTIREMAREAGAEEVAADNGDYFEGCTAFSDKELETFVALVREEEREACAKLCDEVHNRKGFMSDGNASECSDAIRARSNT